MRDELSDYRPPPSGSRLLLVSLLTLIVLVLLAVGYVLHQAIRPGW